MAKRKETACLRESFFCEEDLILQLGAWRRETKSLCVVFTNGCFDLLHVGHVRYLQAAKQLGDKLIIGLNSDASLRRLKGSHRPLQPEKARGEVLGALSCVDAVTLFNEDTPLTLIQKVAPDVLVKGGDWSLEKVVGRDWVEARGGQVHLIPYTEGYSTSHIINKIKSSIRENEAFRAKESKNRKVEKSKSRNIKESKFMRELSLQELVCISYVHRDAQWEECFFEKLVQSKLNLLSKNPQKGMDSWPYMMMSTEEGEVEMETQVETETETEAEAEVENKEDVSVSSLIKWLSGRGLGLCINPQKNPPDYIFSYGMLWHYHYWGSFLKKKSDPSLSLGSSVGESGVGVLKQKVAFSSGQKVYVANPMPEYVPEKPQHIVRSLLQDQGISEPKVLLISKDGAFYDLAFSLDSLGNPPSSEHQGIAEALAWFFPLHYSILLIEEKYLPPFVSL